MGVPILPSTVKWLLTRILDVWFRYKLFEALLHFYIYIYIHVLITLKRFVGRYLCLRFPVTFSAVRWFHALMPQRPIEVLREHISRWNKQWLSRGVSKSGAIMSIHIWLRLEYSKITQVNNNNWNMTLPDLLNYLGRKVMIHMNFPNTYILPHLLSSPLLHKKSANFLPCSD